MNSDKTYKVQEILKRMENFDNINLLIKGETKEFEIKLGVENIPHLLGLHYMETKLNKEKATKKITKIFKNNISDQEILSKVKSINGIKQMINVKNRIETFDEFMNNLENGIIVEKTLVKSDIPVNYLIIQSNKNNYYHLAIMSSDNGSLLINYDELEKEIKDYLNTYIVENNKNYFKKSKISEDIKSISIYDNFLEEYIPFSFDEDKNRALIEEFKKGKEFDYKEFLKIKFKEMKFDNKKIDKWKTNKDNEEMER